MHPTPAHADMMSCRPMLDASMPMGAFRSTDLLVKAVKILLWINVGFLDYGKSGTAGAPTPSSLRLIATPGA